MISVFLTVDENGTIFEGDKALEDSELLKEFYANLFLDQKFTLKTFVGGHEYIVEAFDAPIVAATIFKKPGKIWSFQSSTGFPFSFSLEHLFVDYNDRFYGMVDKTFFVFSPKAQDDFFDLVDGSDDDHFIVDDHNYPLAPFYQPLKEVSKSDYWTQVYVEEKNPGWDLNAPAAVLQDMLPRLKLPKSRVLVLGSGFGHDAAFFAQHGHAVTAVDFSAEAIEGARARYPNLTDIQWHQGDLFNLPENFREGFDIVFEHTCFCAIEPKRREEMVQVWKQCLVEGGHLMAVLFSMFKRQGPPYGSTEWEVRRLLEKHFQFLFWGRWRKSISPRQGRELFVYGLKKKSRHP